MTISNASCCVLFCSLGLFALSSNAQPDPGIPHFATRGAVTQLMVDGKPFLLLTGETEEETSTSFDNMRPVWPLLAQMNLNTVLPVVYWGLFEPEEGKYDFTLVDALIQEARSRNLHLGLVWFASWKNGLSLYAPEWVQKDYKRFPRVQTKSGVSTEIFSSIEGYGDATRDADARAFAALLRHVKEVDGRQHTVVILQVENEVGISGDSRDRSPAANKAFEGPVPKDLMDYLQKHKDALIPEFRQVWEAAGFKTIRHVGRGIREERGDG
jgi:beta-galactosidase GanA